MIDLLRRLGAAGLNLVAEAGRMQVFLVQSITGALRPPLRLSLFIEQVHFLGVRSWPVIVLTGAFTGAVISLQGYHMLRRFGSEAALGSGVALSLVRELGPVLTALMVTGRAGSAMSAELGIMRINEQVDALETMNLGPIKFLASPRITAMIFIMPLLAAIFIIVGLIGGRLVGVELLGVNAGAFYYGLIHSISARDLVGGLVKTIVFGATIGLVCAYKGFYTHRAARHGASGVGRSATEAVVLSSVLVLAWDFILTSIMM